MQTDAEFDEIETLTESFRERMGVPEDAILDMPDLLRRMKIAGELAIVVERDAADMGNSAAMFDPEQNAVFVRRGMLAEQTTTRDRFTIAHEIGHKIDGHVGIRHRKANSAKQFGQQVQPDEFRANSIAAALLIPERLARVDQSTTARQLATRFGVSLQVAERRLLVLQRRDRVRRGLRRPIPAALNTGAPDTSGFDTGSYDEAMSQMAHNSRRWNEHFGD